MEAVKLNVMHWHLSDDQGFRVESRQLPLLQEKGSNGSYYTQQQIKRRDRVRCRPWHSRGAGVRHAVPHDRAGWSAIPSSASSDGPYQIATKWGVFDPAMDPTRDATYEFLDKFVEEMTGLFPDAYFHIGGDECNGKEWDANRKDSGLHESARHEGQRRAAVLLH